MSLLQGFKVLDLASVGPAARASRILADYGMEVIKVAPVASKGAKQTEPVYHAYGAGRGTKRIRVDLESAAGKEAIYRLARSVDVMIESFRPGVAQRIGVGYEQIKAHNPRIVYCSTSGYGQDGPCAHCPWMAMNGLQGVIACLENGQGEITVNPAVGKDAVRCIDRMLAYVAANPAALAPKVQGMVRSIGAA